MSLVVFGGNGFLGRRICQEALTRGLQVVSVSSSGKKPAAVNAQDNQWIPKVKWTKGDVFMPGTYPKEIKSAIGVVHSIGILLENANYKKVVSGTDDAFGLIESFFTLPNGDPMKKRAAREAQKAKKAKVDKDGGRLATNVFDVEEEDDADTVLDTTYDRINKESALVLANALVDLNKSKPAFVYVSADRGFPGVPSGYIESKRQAEYELYQLQPQIRPILLRPGFMYDEVAQGNDSFRGAVKSGLDLANMVNSKLLGGALDGLVRPAISTQTVSRWALDKIQDPEFHGPVLMDQMLNVGRK